jgi:hypothetical protein
VVYHAHHSLRTSSGLNARCSIMELAIATAMAASSVHSPGCRLNGPPPVVCWMWRNASRRSQIGLMDLINRLPRDPSEDNPLRQTTP